MTKELGKEIVEAAFGQAHYSRVQEYKAIADKWDSLELGLTRQSEWTPKAAQELVKLADNYGAWFLRHAAALAEAIGKEDGDRGF